MTFLLDVNLPPTWTPLLAEHGIEAIHWYSVGRENARDEEIMSYALSQNLVIVTKDLDFGHALAESGAARPSVIQIRFTGISAHTVDTKVLDVLLEAADQLGTGALITIKAKRTRLRLLPLSAALDEEL